MSFDDKTLSLAQIYLSMLENNKKTPQELAEAKCKAGKTEAIEITTSNKSDVSKSGKKCEDDEEGEGEYDDDEGESDNGNMKVKTKTSKMSEALKGNQHKIDKNKNGKIDSHDFKLLRKEETEISEEVSSGNAQHDLSSESEKKDHADYMKKTHGVSTKYHGKDELSYHGSKSSVKKAVLNHYSDDSSEAKALHPHVFKEETQLSELSKSTLGSYVKKASNDMANKGAAIGKKQADADEVDRYTNRHMSNQSDERENMKKAVGASGAEINKVRSSAIKRTRNIGKAVDRLTKESMEWNWDALLEASEEELNTFIEQLSDEELQSFAEEFEIIDEQIELEEAMVNTKVVKASNEKIKRGFEGGDDERELSPRAPAEIDWVAKHIEYDYQVDVTGTPYKTNQDGGNAVKSQAPARPGDNRKNGEAKMKTLKDFRK
jgi:hypothetical protein